MLPAGQGGIGESCAAVRVRSRGDLPYRQPIQGRCCLCTRPNSLGARPGLNVPITERLERRVKGLTQDFAAFLRSLQSLLSEFARCYCNLTHGAANSPFRQRPNRSPPLGAERESPGLAWLSGMAPSAADRASGPCYDLAGVAPGCRSKMHGTGMADLGGDGPRFPAEVRASTLRPFAPERPPYPAGQASAAACFRFERMKYRLRRYTNRPNAWPAMKTGSLR